MKGPNFSKYSLKELNESLASINREKYPEEFQALVKEIEKRKQGFSVQTDETSDQPEKVVSDIVNKEVVKAESINEAPKEDVSNNTMKIIKAIAIYEIVTGTAGLVMGAINYPNLWFTVFFVSYGFCLYSGILLFQQKPMGITYSKIVQLLTSIHFKVLGLTFYFGSLIKAVISFQSNGDITTRFGFEAGVVELYFDSSETTFLVGINIIAIILYFELSRISKKINSRN